MKCNLFRTELNLGYTGSIYGREMNIRFVLHQFSLKQDWNKTAILVHLGTNYKM